ncbi:MAG: MFS transporter [Pseudomonadales bacterium]|nr:MFS transporter [Pseudomonadales bacterium]
MAQTPADQDLSPTGGPVIYYGYWLIVAAFLAQFVSVGVQNYVIGSFMIPMTDEMGWTRAEFTLPRTLGQVVMAFSGFFIGTWVDRSGAKRFMLMGAVILSVALYALSLIQTLWHWVVLNGVVLTVGAALIGNLVVNVTLAKWFVDFRGRAVAFAAMGVSFAGVFLTPVATMLIDALGWRTAWQWLAICTLLIIVPVAMSMRRAPEDYGLRPDGRTEADVASGKTAKANLDFQNSMTRREALGTSSFYLLVLAFGLFGITIQVMLIQTVPFMTDAGYSRSTAALMITLASVPALLSKPIWGWLIDGLRPKPLASTSAALTGLSLFIIVFAVTHDSLYGVYAGFCVLGFGWGGMIPLQEVIWASFFGRRYLGAVRSAAMPFSIFLTAGAPLATSYYFDQIGNYNGAILTVGSANLLSAVMILLIPEPRKSESAEVSPPDAPDT